MATFFNYLIFQLFKNFVHITNSSIYFQKKMCVSETFPLAGSIKFNQYKIYALADFWNQSNNYASILYCDRMEYEQYSTYMFQ